MFVARGAAPGQRCRDNVSEPGEEMELKVEIGGKAKEFKSKTQNPKPKIRMVIQLLFAILLH